jgi:hypothetical protein
MTSRTTVSTTSVTTATSSIPIGNSFDILFIEEH